MNFVDRTGHIFSLPSYDVKPIGYEYEENPYVFWFDTERGPKLSVNNYYFKPIRVVTKVHENSDVHINIKIENSNKFYLIDSDIIDDAILNIDNINSSIELYEDTITSSKEIDYDEHIDLTNGGFKGCVIDDTDAENQIEIAQQEYYVNAYSGDEYDGTVYSGNSLSLGTYYLDENGDYSPITEDNIDSIILGKITIASLEKYIKLKIRTKSVIVTDENRDQFQLSNILKVDELYLINTFYVVVNSNEQGVWSTNVLINIDDEWCPITVAAEIIDEQEELIINGQNLGIKLPKEIIQAIYSGNYNIHVADETIYYNKMKEYLMNYMKLKGEIGNYRSAINSLKWFEWGDKLTISKLLKNDNRIQRQYVKDFFDLINDNLYSYQLFKDTSLLSIEFKLDEDGEQEEQIQTKNGFIGEGKPIVKSIYNSLKEVQYDEKEYTYVRSYYNFTFNDLGLKLAALKYYYEKYFLPLYIRIHNIYMNHKVYANDIKLINKTSHGITETPIFITTSNDIISEETGDKMSVIINNGYDIVYFNRYYKKDNTNPYITYDDEGNAIDYNLLYIDENYNEFLHYTKDFVESSSNTFYEVNETCLRIPIEFPHNNGDAEYYNVSLILSKYTDEGLLELLNTSFSFIQNDDTLYQSLIIYPRRINENFDILYWIDNIFRIDLIVNNKLYEFIFNVKMPEFNIEMGKLEYKYDDKFRQISQISGNNIKFNACMYLPNLVNVNNISFDEEIIKFSSNISDYVNNNYKEKIKFLNKKYLNVCHLFNLTDNNGNNILFNGGNNNITCMHWNDLSMYASASQNTSLYNNFFNNDGSYKFDTSILLINDKEYDFYLMHDYNQWYVVLISKEPVELKSVKDKKFNFSENGINIGNYKLIYERSDSKFLINRFIYVPSNGINKFKKDDIIVASLTNNDKLCFKLLNGSKWIIKPFSLRMGNVNTVTSNTELAIVSIPDKYSQYERGYYSLSIEYCVDDITQHVYTKRTQFRIDD